MCISWLVSEVASSIDKVGPLILRPIWRYAFGDKFRRREYFTEDIACLAWRFWSDAQTSQVGRGHWNCEEIGVGARSRALLLLRRSVALRSAPDKTPMLRRLQRIFYWANVFKRRINILQERTILSWHLRNPHKLKFIWNRWLFFVLDMCSKPIYCALKIAEKEKNCSRLVIPQKVAPNAKSYSNVAEHNRYRPSRRRSDY